MTPPGNPLAEALDNPADAPAFADPGALGSNGSAPERPPFPLGCPVKPLGISSNIDGSQKCFYLDCNGQLVGLEAGNRHGKNSMIALFGATSDWLEECFPQWSAPQYEGRGKDRQLVKPSEIVGFDQAEASRALIEECCRRGIFDPAGRMRGRGAHALPAGKGLALHCGDKLLIAQHKADGSVKGWKWEDVGLFERFVYTAGEPIPRPWHEPAGIKPARELLQLLMTWQWKRALIDPRLLLGWIGAAMVGGALDWRPSIWLTGGRGTGKSTLNGEGKVIHRLFGEGLFRTGNASAAAIRQTLKNSTVPVVFDEIEATADNRRVQEVIELARVSATGDKIHRGGADHQAHEFTLRSCFQFSSINIPPLEPQDRSRLALLELNKFAPGTQAPVLDHYNLPDIGRQLQRRMIDGWKRLEATKGKFHAALALAGHDARACDQFGTLLACADLLLHDWDTADGLADDEEVNEWASRCRPDRMAEVSEATPDEEACLIHLLTSMVQARGGDEREALGSWIGKAVTAAQLPLYDPEIDAPEQDRSARRLQQIGLKLVNPVWRPAAGDTPGRWGAQNFQADLPGFLAVASGHQGLAKLFEGTKWQGGVYKQALGRCEHAIDQGVKVKFDRASLRAVLVPLHYVLDESELPAASKPDALAAWLDGKGAEA